MWALIHFKVKVGTALNSQAILADAGCTRICLILSGVLLAASLIYQLTGIGWVDSMGSISMAWLSFREGREAFEKASGIGGCGCCCGKWAISPFAWWFLLQLAITRLKPKQNNSIVRTFLFEYQFQNHYSNIKTMFVWDGIERIQWSNLFFQSIYIVAMQKIMDCYLLSELCNFLRQRISKNWPGSWCINNFLLGIDSFILQVDNRISWAVSADFLPDYRKMMNKRVAD